MKATFDGTWVRLGSEGRSLYEQSGYGRPEKDGLRLAPEEASYLVLRNRIEIAECTPDLLLARFARDPHFIRSFMVYRDLRERGYAVQTGPHDFRVFKRGQRPGSGQSQYMVRVLSERDLVDFSLMIKEAGASVNMRKQHVLAIVDDESELTYYEIKLQALQETGLTPESVNLDGYFMGRSAIVHVPVDGPAGESSFGIRLDGERVILSPLEILYLGRTGALSLSGPGRPIGIEEYAGILEEQDGEIRQKAAVYEDLRKKGYIPRTGYKFGHHFRVYSGQKVHSEMLVHAIPLGCTLPMSVISRSVRLAHSVKKKMLFGCECSEGIQYVEFARIKL